MVTINTNFKILIFVQLLRIELKIKIHSIFELDAVETVWLC